MVPFLFSPREHHHVTDAANYRAEHARRMAAHARRGHRAVVHDSPIVLTARVDANSWLVECECGAGNATDPAWGFACCFGCGAVHEAIVFPSHEIVIQIEDVLLARVSPKTRNWNPQEHASVEALMGENLIAGEPTSRKDTR